MTIVVNALMTLILPVSPFLVDLILRQDLKKQNICFYFVWYIPIFFTFNIFLFSIYRNDSINNLFLYLIKNTNIKYIVIASIINGFCAIILNIKKVTFEFCLTRQKRLVFSLLFALLFVNASLKFNEMYKNVSLDVLIFHIKFPVSGANFFMVSNFIIPLLIDTIIMVSFIVLILSIGIQINARTFYIPIHRIKKILPLLVVLFPFTGIVILIIGIGIPKYLVSSGSQPSTFYEDYYIDPVNVDITFPEKKRNLIVIFVESLETGFLEIEEGGGFYEDLMPEVKKLAKENINFSQNFGIGGVVPVSGTGWTIAGIVSQYSGVPLILPFIDGNEMGALGEEFMPGAYGIGDILNKAGYKSYFMLGSEAEFGGRDKYFKTHTGGGVR